ncbi:MAG: HlyC/CorC family transporter [Flavobacteriales bacterium]|jgi:CBS domain containing-hemolysin-like protein|nr:HlyC/CorC family transporter [Flavobacteriales bacterium]MBT5699018.1 HlyC/CorC family transporter [Flavobacteriales bacterium]MBT6699637.1 HlyC/CorC family transporter [Flavobacteriales bacterium]MBT6816104.1 HlyC/CorC family transporter [Flavobacteriales bacterium]MBT7620725.1 HlyC/CorC family transporter [Flavobacteriales bacterium]
MSLTIVVITLIFSAFFSGIEIAFVSSNKLKLELDKNSDSFISKTIAIFSKDESNFIATMLIGNNIALVIFSISMTELLHPFLQNISSSFLLLFTQTIISTIIILITAEFIPKAIFRINPNYMLKIFSLPLIFFYFLLYPIVFVMLAISGFVLKYIFRLEINEVNQLFSKIDLDEYLESLTQYTNSNSGNNTEVEMLQNALELSNIKVRECMVPRTDMAAINIKSSVEQLLKLFIETKYTKIPVFKDNIDNIIGYVHSADLFKKPITIKSVMLPIPIVSESLTANEMLNTFIKKNKSIALVVDEFGGTSGLVTVEDVTEEIVGEIEDEHDIADIIDEKISDTEYLFSSRMEVDQINNKYNLELPESEEYETIAGLFLSLHEDIPIKGESIKYENKLLLIDSVDEKSIKLIRIMVK